MKTSKTALAAAAFGIVAAFAPAQAGEVKYNFSSELANQEAAVAADGRIEGGQRGFTPSAVAGPEIGLSYWSENPETTEEHFNTVSNEILDGLEKTRQDFVNFGNTVRQWWINQRTVRFAWEDNEPFVYAWTRKDLSYLPGGGSLQGRNSHPWTRSPGGNRYRNSWSRPR